MNYFKRPVIPCLILFIAGATLVSELDGTAVLLGALPATLVAVGTSALRKDATPVFLLFFGALGGVQMATLKHEKQHAADILYTIGPPVSCSVQGRVVASDVESDMGRFRFVLANVELMTDRGQFAWPGRLLVTFRSQGTDSSSAPPDRRGMGFSKGNSGASFGVPKLLWPQFPGGPIKKAHLRCAAGEWDRGSSSDPAATHGYPSTILNPQGRAACDQPIFDGVAART
ncbi:MAG: hypothetical protein KatS3mg130_1827 [Candidatus Sumerlaea sp.]|nr:MAG: hypothetical protein KatS3mg130_1827 [Candidatus Sumerlaea sp.]